MTTATAKTMTQAPAVHSAVRRYDIGFGIEGDAAATIEVEVLWPDAISSQAVFFCVPGGGMNRHFFDLPVEGDSSFSFARQMAAQGFVSVLIDPPGIGGSDRPADGHALTPAVMSDIFSRLHALVRADLEQGKLSDSLAAMPDMLAIGLGHSMGAMLTILHQAHKADYQAVALLGFGAQGLPQFLSPEIRDMLDDQDALRAALPALAKKMFPKPYPVLHSDGGEAGIFGSTLADRSAVKALKAANDVMLPVLAFMSLLPGNVAPEAAGIEVPVYLALGERDLIREPQKVPASFTAASNVQLQILPQTGHSHFLFPTREQLFNGLAQWAKLIIKSNDGV